MDDQTIEEMYNEILIMRKLRAILQESEDPELSPYMEFSDDELKNLPDEIQEKVKEHRAFLERIHKELKNRHRKIKSTINKASQKQQG